MSKELKVISDFDPAGDQPKAIKELVEGINSGLLNQTLLGVTGSGKTFAMAKVIEELQRPAIIMAHNKTLAAQLYGEFKEFLPNNAVEYFVSYYDYYQPEAYVPTTDIYIEKDASINEHINQMRLSATKAVMERRDVVDSCFSFRNLWIRRSQKIFSNGYSSRSRRTNQSKSTIKEAS